MPSARETLRVRTQSAHRRLDQCWQVERLGERGVYTQFLQATAAALIPLEARLTEAGVAGLIGDWASRRRTSAIAADLAGLSADAPRCAAPMFADPAAVIGALYVLEGSRLGGTMLAREVAASADPAVLANRRYLSHGPAGPLWRSFVERLDRQPASAHDALCTGALAAFALFETAALTVLQSA